MKLLYLSIFFISIIGIVNAQDISQSEEDLEFQFQDKIDQLNLSLTYKEYNELKAIYIEEAEGSDIFFRLFEFSPTQLEEIYGDNINKPTPPVGSFEVPLDVLLNAKWGKIEFTSKPDKCDVSLKSALFSEGTTSFSKKYPQGKYTFVFSKAGYKSKENQVDLASKDEINCSVVLEKNE